MEQMPYRMNKTILLFFLLLSAITSLAQEQRFITSDSVNLYLKVKGKGTPCLYIHGGPGSGSYWLEKFSGDILEKRFTMIYLDLRGVGRSTSPVNNDYSMDRMVRDFEEIRKQLGIEQWLIMGHSFSGTTVTGYALRHPTSIKGMMMFNCTLDIEASINKSWIPYACKILGITELSYYSDEETSTHDKLNTLFGLLNKKDLSWKMTFANKENEAKMNSTFSEIPNWNSDFGRIGISHKDYLVNFMVYTAQITNPVLFFYGKTDFTVGPEHYKRVHFPNMLLWGSDVGHVPFMENKEDLQKAIDSYMKKFSL
jgi:proline iminopeptidase